MEGENIDIPKETNPEVRHAAIVAYLTAADGDQVKAAYAVLRDALTVSPAAAESAASAAAAAVESGDLSVAEAEPVLAQLLGLFAGLSRQEKLTLLSIILPLILYFVDVWRDTRAEAQAAQEHVELVQKQTELIEEVQLANEDRRRQTKVLQQIRDAIVLLAPEEGDSSTHEVGPVE